MTDFLNEPTEALAELEQVCSSHYLDTYMTSRRASAKPDGDATHLAAWKQAYTALHSLSSASAITESIGKANKAISKFETEYFLPETTADALKPTKKLIKNEIANIKTLSETEIKTCDEVLRQIENVIKLRQTPDTTNSVPAAEKRPKRREASTTLMASQPNTSVKTPVGTAGVPAASAANGLTLHLPPRSAVLQQIQTRTQKQLPLKPGRKVAFRVPGDEGKTLESPPLTDGSSYVEAGWILATIRGLESNGKYMVQDVEGENGQEPPIYPASLSSIIPLPIPGVPSTDPSHWSAYPEYKSESFVLALYPETTSFYRAQVVASPKDLAAAGTRTAPVATRAAPSYKLRFDEDENQVRHISAEEVIEFPGY